VIGEDVELVVEPAASLAAIRADPGQVEQLVMNLAVNARDAMPKGRPPHDSHGRHRVRRATPSEITRARRLDVRVDRRRGHGPWHPRPNCSNGCSSRSSTTKPLGKGTGLGLATVYGIAKQSGGFVSTS